MTVQSFYFRGYIFSLLILVFIRPWTSLGNQANDLLKQEFIRKVKAAAEPWDDIKAWLITYEGLPFPDNGQFTPVHRVFAVASPGQIYRIGAHFSPYPWEKDPFAQELFVDNGNLCHRWPFNRIYSEAKIPQGEIIPGSLPQDVLLAVIPHWPVQDYLMPVGKHGTRVTPHEALHANEYKLISGSETVNGEECEMIDNGADRIWISSQKGLCVMRRDIRDPQSGRILERILTDKVKEIEPGLWMPIEFRNQFFPMAMTNNSMEREYRLKVTKVSFNNSFSHAIFTPKQLPGALLNQSENESTQMLGGGEDLLEDITGFLQRYVSFPHGQFVVRHRIYCFVVGLVSGSLLILISRKPKKGNSSSFHKPTH